MKYVGVLGVWLCACSSPSNSHPSDAAGDAPASDAPHADGPNGAPADGDPDAAQGQPSAGALCDRTAPPGVVRVRSGTQGAWVVVDDAAGNYVSTGMTDSTRVAEVVVPGCGMVTVVIPNAYVRTFTNVMPGDDVSPEAIYRVGTPLPPVDLWIDSPYPDADGYMVTPLTTTAGPDPDHLVLYPGTLQVTAGRSSLVVEPARTMNNTDYTYGYAYAFFDDVVIDPQSPLHVTSWLTSPPAHHVVAHLPFSNSFSGTLFAGALAHGQRLATHQAIASGTPTDPAFDVQFPEPGEGATFEVGVSPGTDELHTYMHEYASPVAPSLDIDLTSGLLPAVSNANLSSDPARPTVSWSMASSSTPFAATFVTIHPDTLDWAFWVPPDVTSFRVPELPANLAPTFQHPGARIEVTEYASTIWNDYAGARAAGAARHLQPGDTLTTYTNRSAQ